MNFNKIKRAGLGKSLILLAFFLILINISSDTILGNKELIFGYAQKAALYVSLFILLTGFYLLFPDFLIKLNRIFSIILFSFGLILLIINTYGEFQSLRNPKLNQNIYPYQGKSRTIKITQDEAQSSLNQYENESPQQYAHRLTELIFDSTVHHWVNNPVSLEDLESSIISDYNLRVPIYENYIIWAYSYFSNNSEVYEFCNPYLAIERGASVCSQTAKILGRVLELNGYTIRLSTLGGHVITEVLINPEIDEWWVLDADYGLVIEKDVSFLEKNSGFVKSEYIKAGYSEQNAEKVKAIYGPEGNFIFQHALWGICEAEARLYQLKWQIPLLLLIPYSLLFVYQTIKKT